MSESALENIYRSHHDTRRGRDFVLLGGERGAFLMTGIGKDMKVLDIGCRDGALTRTYAEGNHVLGLDIDSEALQRAREVVGIETRQTDLNGDWGIAPASYDRVVAAEVIEHLYYPSTVLDKIRTALKPDGVLLGTVPNAFSLANRARYLMKRKRGTPLMDPTHINHFTVEELRSLLNDRFESVRIIGLGRLGALARSMPQSFAFDLAFEARGPRA